MGYFGQTFMFTSEPAFSAIAARLPARALRGYRHRERLSWLLDIWSPGQGEHWPFTQRAPRVGESSLAPSVETRHFLDGLGSLVASLGEYEEVYGLDESRLALAVARHAAVPTYLFVSDDEHLDYACCVKGDSLSQLRCRMGHVIVCLEGDTTWVEVEYFADDEETQPPVGLIDAITHAVRWPIGEPMPLEGGLPLAGSALALWPQSAGDPDGLLGFDRFMDLEADYEVVFEQR